MKSQPKLDLNSLTPREKTTFAADVGEPTIIELARIPVPNANALIGRLTALTSKVQIASRANASVKDLASATRYWFRVAAIGATGPSQWTNPTAVLTQ